MTVLKIDTAAVFEPLLKPSRYKGIWGGRGSGKSHFFAGLMIEEHILYPGMRSVCVREVQKTLKHSVKQLLVDKINAYDLMGQGFEVQVDQIKTPGGGFIAFAGMQDHNADSVKSYEGFDRAWIEETQTLSNRSLTLLRPTIRSSTAAPTAEIWASWNPRRKTDPIDVLLRQQNHKDAIVVKSNYYNNPDFPDELEGERVHDFRMNPDSYGHVWEGEYVSTVDGAYFAKSLTAAKKENRIGIVPRDALMMCYAFWDIGGTGAKSDACAIWIVQFIGKEIRVLNYYEAQGQELSEHVGWLRDNNYSDAKMYLPHDGVKHDMVHRVTYESALKQAGFKVEVIPNSGTGAANQRIEAIRRVFPRVWIDAENCSGGIEALGWYHERKDEARGIGLGPEHDWSSHAADSFGAMALESEKLSVVRKKSKNRSMGKQSSGSWMGG